ncbi:hypothetical protein D9M70_436050 [compost metagenome]
MPARLPGGVRQADHGDVVGLGHGKSRLRRRQVRGGQCVGGSGTGDADDGAGGRDIGQLGLGAQHEHRQPLLHRRLDVGRQLQNDAFSIAPHQEGGEQAPLGRTVAGQARGARLQVLDRIGELGVQEAGGIVAGHADQSEPGGGADDSAGLQGFRAGGEFRGLGIHHWHCEIVAIVGTDCRDKAGWKGTGGGARGRVRKRRRSRRASSVRGCRLLYGATRFSAGAPQSHPDPDT